MDEQTVVASFVIPSKVARYSTFVRGSKTRRKFIEHLYHFSDFDPAVVVRLPGARETSDDILHELRSRGASNSAYVISTNKAFDRKTIPLEQAIRDICALVEGTIVVCGPKLAYYEGEVPKNRFILHRQGVGVG